MSHQTIPMKRDAIECAEVSRGVSAWHIYDLCTLGLDVKLNQASRVLDLGCGQGDLGAYLRNKGYRGVLDGADGVAYPEFRKECYQEFFLCDFDRDFEGIPPGSYDLVLMPEVIHCLENPRALARRVTPLLRQGGSFVFSTSNPLSFFSLIILLRHGVFRSFQELPCLYPVQITPLVPLDGRRIAQEAGLKVQSLEYNDRTRLPGSFRMLQDFLPFARGRWFSDHYRVVATKE